MDNKKMLQIMSKRGLLWLCKKRTKHAKPELAHACLVDTTNQHIVAQRLITICGKDLDTDRYNYKIADSDLRFFGENQLTLRELKEFFCLRCYKKFLELLFQCEMLENRLNKTPKKEPLVIRGFWETRTKH